MSSSDDGCGNTIAGIVGVFIVFSIIFGIVDFISENWESIAWFFGWVLMIALGISFVYGIVWYVREGHVNLQRKIEKQRERKQRKQQERQQKIREKVWHDTPLGKNSKKLEQREVEAQERVDELKAAIQKNDMEIKKFKSLFKRSVVTDRLREDVEAEIIKINQAIEVRSDAINWYEGALSRIAFEKIKIENAKTDYIAHGGAEKNYHEAKSFMRDLNELIAEIEGNLEELHVHNKYGYDERINVRRNLSNNLLKPGNPDTLDLNHNPRKKEKDELKLDNDYDNMDGQS